MAKDEQPYTTAMHEFLPGQAKRLGPSTIDDNLNQISDFLLTALENWRDFDYEALKGEQDAKDLTELAGRVQQFSLFLQHRIYSQVTTIAGLHGIVKRLHEGWQPMFTPKAEQPHRACYWYKQDATSRDVTAIVRMGVDEYHAYRSVMDPEG